MVACQLPLAQSGPHLLIYFSSSHGHIAQILWVTVTGVHATTWGNPMFKEVGAAAPVGVVLNAAAAQLEKNKSGMIKEIRIINYLHSLRFHPSEKTYPLKLIFKVCLGLYPAHLKASS